MNHHHYLSYEMASTRMADRGRESRQARLGREGVPADRPLRRLFANWKLRRPTVVVPIAQRLRTP